MMSICILFIFRYSNPHIMTLEKVKAFDDDESEDNYDDEDDSDFD